MKKITALLMLMIVCFSFTNAQCPITKPTFTVQRVNGNTFTFINTTVVDTSAYHVVYTWTFGDGHFIQNPTSDTVTNVYTNTYMNADSFNQYSVSLGVEISDSTGNVCNPLATDTVRIAICNPVIVALPNDSFISGTVLDFEQLNNAQIAPMFIWFVNSGGELTFDPTLTGYKAPSLHAGDTVFYGKRLMIIPCTHKGILSCVQQLPLML